MKLRITEMSPAILILLSKDTIIHGWLNMCDPHSELVQCSISPLCVSVWRDIQLLQQAPSAHLESIHPPVWGHDAALWHPLTCHCCREAAALPSSSLWHLFLNILHSNTHYIGHNPEHISDCVNSNDALPTVFVSKHGVWCCPSPQSVAAWLALKWPSCVHAVPAQLSLVRVSSCPSHVAQSLLRSPAGPHITWQPKCIHTWLLLCRPPPVGGLSGHGNTVNDWPRKGKGKVRERDEE